MNRSRVRDPVLSSSSIPVFSSCAGIVGAERVKATFSIDRGSARGAREYVVFYVYDPAAKQGFVYLPGRGEPFYRENVNLLYRGDEFEGHWFRTASEWTSEAQATIEKARR